METPIVTLQRAFMSPGVTMGMIQVSGVPHFPIYTLENPWLDNRQIVSCIPADSYVCEPFSGTKYKKVWQVMGVPGRSAILLHHGNTEVDTNGCILLGMSAGEIKGSPAVLESRKAIEYFRSIIGNKSFILIIKDNKGV